MTIQRSQLESLRYFPELIPGADVVSPAATNQEEIFNIRIPADMAVRLMDVGAYYDPVAAPTQLAELRLKADSRTIASEEYGIPNMILPTWYNAGGAAPWLHTYPPVNMNLFAEKSISYHVFAYGPAYGGADLVGYPTWYSMWAWPMSVVEKIILDIPLNQEEQGIAERRGLHKTTQAGTLPAKIPRFKLYEYWPYFRETRGAFYTNVTTNGVQVATLRPKRERDMFIALERITASKPSAHTDNCRINIMRDADGTKTSPFISLQAWTMMPFFDIPCFIPAMQDITIRVDTDVAQANYAVRYTFGMYHMNNILRTRFGLVTVDEVGRDLWERVKAGIV